MYESLSSVDTLSQSSLKEISSLTRCALCANDCNTPSRDVRFAIIVKSRTETWERAKPSRFGKKLADEQRKRRRRRDTHRTANARERNSHYFGAGDVYNPTARVFLFFRFLLAHPRRLRLVVVLVGFSPSKGISEREGRREGETVMHACARTILSISLFRVVLTGSLRCVASALLSRRTKRATQNSLAYTIVTRFPFQG